MPAIAHFHGDAGMAAMTQRHKIVLSVGATARKRKNVVDFVCRHQLALLLAFLTEWVCPNEAVTDTFPATTVAFVRSGVTLILVVLFVHDLLMLGTVLLVPSAEIAYSEPTAAGVGTGTLGFIRHRFTSLQA
jgi:hypothetical protein